MKKIAAQCLALMVVAGLMFTSVSHAAPLAGRVYVVSGSVFVAQGKNPAHWVAGNEAIVSDMIINTGDNSAALLTFEDGQIVTMQANSILQIRDYRYDAQRFQNSQIVLSMFKGGMRFITGLIGQKNKQAFRLATPTSTIGIRGTEFMVVMAGKSLYSQVQTGSVTLTNAAGTTTLGAGKSALVTSANTLASLVSAVPQGLFSELVALPISPLAISVGISVPAPSPAVGAAVVPEIPVDAPDNAANTPPAELPAALPAEPVAPSKGEGAGKTEDSKAGEDVSHSGFGLTGKSGTLGYGIEFNFGSTDRFSTRVGLNAFTFKRNLNSSLVNYDIKLQLQTASVLADWYPFAGSFRTSGGVFYNNNKLTLNAVPGSAGYTINGVTYTSTEVGSLLGSVTFNKAAPYLGIGWGNPVAADKGWGMTSDFGVLYHGNPKTSLVATCGSATFGTAVCNQIQADAAAENTKLNTRLSKYKVWPVVSFGISYQW